jgi:hypothetical protein
MTEEVHLNDIGTKFLLTVKEDGVALNISTATVKSIVFKKPSGTVVVKTATFETDGADGKIYYLSVSGDLDAIGLWKIQGKITMGVGSWGTEIGEFKVMDNL